MLLIKLTFFLPLLVIAAPAPACEDCSLMATPTGPTVCKAKRTAAPEAAEVMNEADVVAARDYHPPGPVTGVRGRRRQAFGE